MMDGSAFTGSCHCGAVQLSISHKPEILVDCNCSWCAKTGVWWGYFKPSERSISGETRTYLNKDRDPPFIALHFCGTCGCITHWSSLPIWEQDKQGVNMRLFDQCVISGVELRFSDGKNWNRRDPPGVRQESIILP
jgi:hypothetical protein